MKRSLMISAIAIGAYYLIRQFLGKEEAQETMNAAPRQKHLTNAFSKAKEHAIATA